MTETKADRTRRRILEVAAHEFAIRGYGGASLRRIADAAELKLGSLAFHFATKDELVAAVLADGVASAREALAAAVTAVPDSASPEDRVRAAIAGHLEALHASDDRAAAVVRMVETVPTDLREAHLEHERSFAEVWSKVLRRGQKEGAVRTDVPLRILRDLLIGALNSTATTSPLAVKDLRAIGDGAMTLLTAGAPAAS